MAERIAPIIGGSRGIGFGVARRLAMSGYDVATTAGLAKAFAESDPEKAIAAYRRATAINQGVAYRVNPTWRLAVLLNEHDLV